LKSNRCGILVFCGSPTKVEFDVNGDEGKFCFRKLENGQYKDGEVPKTRHSNILNSVMIGKKSWGLWVDQWSEGIVDWTFTEKEILDEFQTMNIQIPEPLLRDFRNRIEKKRRKRNQEYFDMLNKDKTQEVKKDDLDDYSEFLGSGGMWV
jgi:hypothetical protein